MKIKRGFIVTSDNERLFYTKIESTEGEAKANIVVYHGLNHSGKFLELGMKFAEKGFLVHLIDMRGFGYSGGLRFNSTMEILHKDLLTVIKLMPKKMP